jgi:hypothetical protein
MIEGVEATGDAAEREDCPIFVTRNLYTEEAYFSVSLTPIITESCMIGGVISQFTETTSRVLGARRLK